MKLIERKSVLTNSRFEVVCDEVLHEDMQMKTYHYINKPNAVLAVPLYRGMVGLIATERYLLKCDSLEFVGGRVEENEKPIDALKRELKEECNLVSNAISFLCSINPLPSLTTEVVDIYSVELGSIDSLQLQKAEHVKEMKFYDMDELYSLIMNGKIKSGVDAFAISLILLRYEKNRVI